ncbi:MAG TPA: AMP-binding protein, partial [Blastocatellia bacterium]|nr:AMP-binding protein [Blastocatellia bacterium]
ELARGLIALGVERRENVAVWAPNVPEWVLLQMALAKIGAVQVTVNTVYKAAELEYVLCQGDIGTLVLVAEHRGNSYLDSIYSIAPELQSIPDPVHERLHSPRLPALKRVVLIGGEEKPGLIQFDTLLTLASGISEDDLKIREADVHPCDVVQMQFTSGTTGFPKGVMLTHDNLVNQAHVCSLRAGFQSDERLVSAMPFFHVAGCVGGILFSLYLGATLIPLISFDPAKELELFSIEKATISFNVPTMLIAMLNHPRFAAGEFDLSPLRHITTGATPVPVVLMEQVKGEMGADCSIVYGMTETSGAVTQSMHDDGFELKSATVGLPLPHMDLKIVDPVMESPVPLGQAGELLVRGPLVMKGYYHMAANSVDAIDNQGWLHTGDLAIMNQNGYLNIAGRVKDMIIRGGENIYPAEVEAFLMRHPKIAEAQIVGVPDAFMGEEAAAFLRLKSGETAEVDEIREYCRLGISKHKAPRYIEFVSAYPLTSSGKVKKFELRKQLVKALGLEDASG